jgi:hypothetical protein
LRYTRIVASHSAFITRRRATADRSALLLPTPRRRRSLRKHHGTFRGLLHARCLIGVALGGDLCDGDTIPPKLDQALRTRLTKAALRVDAAMASEGRKRIRLLKKARGLMGVVGRKAAAAHASKKPDKRISSPCASGLGTLVSAVQADLS